MFVRLSFVFKAAPSIKEPLKDKIIKEGEPVEFSIQVVGNPIPTVQWFLNGKELSNSPDFQIFSKDDVHTLRISEVFDEDKGLYTVLAKNKYGETTDRARLKVSGLLVINYIYYLFIFNTFSYISVNT